MNDENGIDMYAYVLEFSAQTQKIVIKIENKIKSRNKTGVGQNPKDFEAMG